MTDFPFVMEGRLLQHAFRGRAPTGGWSDVHSRYGLLTRGSPEATVSEGSCSFVTSTAASAATGWNDQLPDGTFTRKIPGPFHGAHNQSATTFEIIDCDNSEMGFIFHPLLALIASATDRELAKYIQFLKEENKILRARIPGVIHTHPHEREWLIKFKGEMHPSRDAV